MLTSQMALYISKFGEVSNLLICNLRIIFQVKVLSITGTLLELVERQ